MSADFADLYDEHVWDVYGYLAYRVADRAEAEDLTQLTFERALRAWRTYDPRRASPRTWLMAIARNLAIDHFRRVRPEPVGDGLDEVATPEPDPDLGLSPELAAAVAALGPREREVLALRFGGDLTGPEIAQALELSLANVQQIVSRALGKLRAGLQRSAIAPS